MSTIIAFSGASNSGKTTLMNKMKEWCTEHYGKESVKILGEVIRREPVDITEVRKDGSDYFERQLKWTGEKMRMERELFWEPNPRLVLIDRSLADSLFYINFYINKSQLSPVQIAKFADFYREVSYTLKDHVQRLYNYIFMPTPIESITQDGFRYANLKAMQSVEYTEIRKNTFYASDMPGTINKIINQPIGYFYENPDAPTEELKLAKWVKDVISK